MNTPALETLAPPSNFMLSEASVSKKARFWDKIANRYAIDPIADMVGYNHTLERTRTWLAPTQSVLEIGCGTGSTALHLAPSVANYVGTDVSAHMVAIARAKLALHPCPGLRFESADADAPLSALGPCEVVLAFNVLHLVQSLDDTLALCAAVLKPGGLLISKTPCLAEMNPLIPWLVVPIARALGKAPAVHTLDQADLAAAMKAQELEVVAIERHAGKGRDVRPFIVARKPL